MNKSESKYFNTATIATPPMLLNYIIQYNSRITTQRKYTLHCSKILSLKLLTKNDKYVKIIKIK